MLTKLKVMGRAFYNRICVYLFIRKESTSSFTRRDAWRWSKSPVYKELYDRKEHELDLLTLDAPVCGSRIRMSPYAIHETPEMAIIHDTLGDADDLTLKSHPMKACNPEFDGEAIGAMVSADIAKSRLKLVIDNGSN